jgi:DNA invertase Pin-like site-specific DNA recombinase
MTTAKRAAIYTRLGGDAQTTEDQLSQLRQYAAGMDYRLVAELSDGGIHGGKGCGDRPGLKRLRSMIARKEVEIILVGSLDGMFGSLSELVAFLQGLRAAGVDLFLHRHSLDTSSRNGEGALQLIGALSSFEQSLIAGRIRAGIENARREKKRVGRPSVASSPTVMASVRELRERGMSVHAIAKALKIGVGTTAKILAA